jgi:adenylyl-sulfate kinase
LADGFTVWLTGLSGAGKTTISQRVADALRERGLTVEVLDGDVVRTNICKGLGFSKADRDENVRRVGWVCHYLSANGRVAVAAFISPYREVRDELRQRIGRFVEVYVECPLETLLERDVKGLYKQALAGQISNFTGVNDPYEPPLEPDVTVHTDRETPEESTARVIVALEQGGYLRGANGRS